MSPLALAPILWRLGGSRRMSNAALVVVVALSTLVALAPSVSAQEDRVTVRLDGRALFRVGPLDDQTADERARQIERRLLTLLENPDAIAPARIELAEDAGDERVITVASVPVVTVTQSDADDNLMTVGTLAAQWRSAIDEELQRASGRRLSAWGRFTAETQGAVETAFRRVGESTMRMIPRAFAAILIVLLFWMLATVLRWLMRLLFHRVVDDLTTENLIKQVAYYAVWVLGIIVAVDALGIDPQTAATGLGLTGLALGFGLRDILSNFVSGILILSLRPFRIGDEIVVGETEGSVERIDLRATQMRTYDGRRILVPNAELFTSRVTNNTASPIRRGSIQLALGADIALDRAIQTILSATRTTEGVLETPDASVRIRDISGADLLVEARYWTDSRRSDFVATESQVRRAIVDGLMQAGIALPDPSRVTLAPASADAVREAMG